MVNFVSLAMADAQTALGEAYTDYWTVTFSNNEVRCGALSQLAADAFKIVKKTHSPCYYFSSAHVLYLHQGKA